MTTPPRLQAHKGADFENFTDDVKQLLDAAWGKDWGTFCEAFPNGKETDSVKLPVITYSLKEMQPGVISKNGTREIKARHRETYIEDVNGNGSRAIEVFGRIFDCVVVFEVWEENNVKASALAKEFMIFIDLYLGYFKSRGVKELIFRHLKNTTESGSWRDNVVCRSLNYDLRLEYFYEVPSDLIEKVTGIVSVTTGSSDSSINETIPVNPEP